MNRKLLSISLALAVSVGLSAINLAATPAAADAHALAEVNRHQGLLIFSDCTPQAPYEYLGSVSPKGMGWVVLGTKSPQYETMRDLIIKEAKRLYPTGQGIILALNSGGKDHADVIRFKE
ncbi:MAG: hypothetical protein EOP50_00485 [Sphingobacteriales bacterium]|nr:MAG: hypothetical protein EOP50_00485 [Sphingobacteriales bacterium]